MSNLILNEATLEEGYNELMAAAEGLEPDQVHESVMRTLEIEASRAISACANGVVPLVGYAADSRSKLLSQLNSYNGSEVADTNLQRSTAWTKLAEYKLERAEALYGSVEDLDLAKAVFASFFKKKWVKYDPSAKPNPAELRKTAAAVAACEVLGIELPE